MDREDLRNVIRMSMPPEVTDVTDTNLNLLLNAGVEECSAYADWPFLQKKSNLSLTADTRTVDLPADFLKGVKLIDDDYDQAIPFMSPDKLFQNIGNDTGNESTRFDYWSIYENKIYLSPIPSAADTNRLTIYYFKTPTTLTADSSTPEWPTAFHMILVEYVKWKLYEREGLVEQAQAAYANYLRYISDMQTYYNNIVTQSPSIYGGGKRPRRRAGHWNIPWWPFAE